LLRGPGFNVRSEKKKPGGKKKGKRGGCFHGGAGQTPRGPPFFFLFWGGGLRGRGGRPKKKKPPGKTKNWRGKPQGEGRVFHWGNGGALRLKWLIKRGPGQIVIFRGKFLENRCLHFFGETPRAFLLGPLPKKKPVFFQKGGGGFDGGFGGQRKGGPQKTRRGAAPFGGAVVFIPTFTGGIFCGLEGACQGFCGWEAGAPKNAQKKKIKTGGGGGDVSPFFWHGGAKKKPIGNYKWKKKKNGFFPGFPFSNFWQPTPKKHFLGPGGGGFFLSFFFLDGMFPLNRG